MKKIKKIALGILIPALLLSSSLPVLALEKQSSKQSTYAKLLDEGLSEEDATYYAELQDSLVQLKKDNKKINLDSISKRSVNKYSDDSISKRSVNKYSDDYIRKNKKKFRESILKHDPAAVKKAIENALEVHFEGNEMLSKLVNKDIKKNGKPKSFYEITFPSGDSMQVSFDTVKQVESDSDAVETNGSSQPYAGPWGTHVTTLGLGTLPKTSGNWGTSKEVKFFNAAGYASNYLQIKYKLDQKNTTKVDDDTVSVYYTYTTGSSSGVMEVVNSNPNVGRPYDNASKASNIYTQTFSDATMKLSAAVEGSYTFGLAGIAVTLTHSTIWHEFTIIEVAYNGQPVYYGGYKL